ncbi:hypothetical protein FRC10_002167 [Ceratobasidium sp. 414]|nr:hypothetical protein FRC10_002167 [Ceratobasidium sp. 414]
MLFLVLNHSFSRQIHYFLNDRSEREAFVTFKYKSDAVYAKTKHSFGDVQIFGITDEFWKNRYVESQNADPVKSGMQQVNDYDTFMPHAISQPTPAPAGDDYLSDPAGFAIHVEGEVHGSPTDCKFTRFGPVTSRIPTAWPPLLAISNKDKAHLGALMADVRPPWFMNETHGQEMVTPDVNRARLLHLIHLVLEDQILLLGLAQLDMNLRQGMSPPDTSHAIIPLMIGLFQAHHVLPTATTRLVYLWTVSQHCRDSIGWKDSRDYPPSGYERDRLSPGYVAADPRYDPLPSRPRDYDDRGRQPPQRESTRYSPYPQRSPVIPHYASRDRVPASTSYPPPLPVDARLDDIPRRERAPGSDSRHLSRSLDGPAAPLTKPLSATATSEEALNTLKFMRDMQCQPSQYHIAAEKEPRFADAEALALEGIKVALSTQRPSEAAPLYLFLARLQGERFKTERNPALVLRLARDVVVNLDEASALSRQPLEASMQSLRQDVDVEMVDVPRPTGEDPDAQVQRLMDKLRRAREDIRRMEDDLDRERRERRRIQTQLADAQDSLTRTTRAAKNDIEDMKKANERHMERIAELERELERKSTPKLASMPFTPLPAQPRAASETPGEMNGDSKDGVMQVVNEVS